MLVGTEAPRHLAIVQWHLACSALDLTCAWLKLQHLRKSRGLSIPGQRSRVNAFPDASEERFDSKRTSDG